MQRVQGEKWAVTNIHFEAHLTDRLDYRKLENYPEYGC